MSTIQLLRKAAQIIDELALSGAATPAELAKALAEPRPSVYRILASLEETGYVRSTNGGRLELGATILRLGESAVSAVVDREGLRKQLTWVREQLGMSAFFCVLHQEGAVCLEQVDGSDVDLLDLAPGRKIPLHAGAASRILLAFSTEEMQDKHQLNESYGRLGTNTPVNCEDLRLRVERAVLQGWELDEGELAGGVSTIAVPVLDPHGGLIGAIAAAGLSKPVWAQKESAKAILASAANAIANMPPVSIVEELAESPHTSDISSSNGVPRSSSVISKASALMAVIEDEGLVTPSRLTERLGEPTSSIYRMLGTLADAGWVEQAGPRGAYRVGMHLFFLAEELIRRLDIRQVASPIMRDIHAQTGETTFLCIRRGGRAVCIERIDGVRVNSRVLQLGESLPLHMGAAPLALLAFEDPTVWEEYVSAVTHIGQAQQDLTSRAELFAGLEHIRDKGYVTSDNNVTHGIAAIGSPVFNHRGEVVASLSVSGLREVILADHQNGHAVSDLVRRGARALSVGLGAPVDEVLA